MKFLWIFLNQFAYQWVDINWGLYGPRVQRCTLRWHFHFIKATKNALQYARLQRSYNRSFKQDRFRWTV